MSLGPYKCRHLLTLQRPAFTYTERNDNLSLCVIQDILELAFLDGAFASECVKEPRDIWRFTHVPGHQLSTPPYTLKRALKTSQYSDMPSGTPRVIGLLMQHKPFLTIKCKNTRLPPASQLDLRIPVLCINIEKEQQST